MVNDFTFEERMRTAHVTRWQIVRTARTQTLAEHLYLVHVITSEMCSLAGFDVSSTMIAKTWALEHDVPEVKTGDLATPVKAAMREAVPHDDPIRRIELSYSDSYAALYHVVKEAYPHVRALVKMADTFEAIHFLGTEAMGKHAHSVKFDLWNAFIMQINDAVEKYPDFNWASIHTLARKHCGP